MKSVGVTHEILWPKMRWADHREIETEAVAPNTAHIYDDFALVPDEVWARADAIISVIDVPEEYRRRLENCRIFVTPKVGFDNIDLGAWAAAGIPVANVPDYGTQEVADHTLALLLSLVRCLPMHQRRLAADPVKGWKPPDNPLARRLSTSVCGIVGLGRIGTAFALRAKVLGMDVVCYDPYLPNGGELAIGIRRAESLAELLAQADIVSVHVPLSDETRGLIGADALAHADDLILVNCARGEVVDIDALYEALRDGRVRAAGLDVLPEEPPDLSRPLIAAWAAREDWLVDRLLISPHSAFSTPESVRDMRVKPCEVALRYLDNGVLQNCVNLDQLERSPD